MLAFNMRNFMNGYYLPCW